MHSHTHPYSHCEMSLGFLLAAAYTLKPLYSNEVSECVSLPFQALVLRRSNKGSDMPHIAFLLRVSMLSFYLNKAPYCYM